MLPPVSARIIIRDFYAVLGITCLIAFAVSAVL
jgi:hypothetical protein